MADIPKYYLIFLQKACDIDKNGKLENNAQKDGQTYDEVSIFNKACESYNEKENTVIINGVVKRIQELVYEGIEEFRGLFSYTEEKPDAISNYPRERAELDLKVVEKEKEKEKEKDLPKKDMSQPSYFETDLTKKDWAKSRLESDMRNKTVRKNLSKFEPFFKEAAKTYGVPKNVLKAICLKESTMGKDSSNVMQINPITAKELKISNVNNPRACIMKAAELLKSRLEMSDGNIAKALVGYNVGYNKPAFQNWKEINQGGYADKVLSFALAFDELDKQNKVT